MSQRLSGYQRQPDDVYETPAWENRTMGDYQMAKEAYENKPDRGVLFRNEQKDPASETDRDYTGSLNVGGVEYWLSAWVKVSKTNGKKYLSLAVKPKNDALGAKKSAAAFDAVPF